MAVLTLGDTVTEHDDLLREILRVLLELLQLRVDHVGQLSDDLAAVRG